MSKQLSHRIASRVQAWFARETSAGPTSCEFAQVHEDIRPGDVLLVEGRSPYSRLIQLLTRSRWTHCALYIGNASEITGLPLNGFNAECAPGSEPALIIEANLGEGVVIEPLAKYARHNVRICRPKGLSTVARKRAIAYAMAYLDGKYDLILAVRTAAFLLMQWAFPFCTKRQLPPGLGPSARVICTDLVWRSFHPVRFPVFPFDGPRSREDDRLNKGTSLLTPSIFLQSPNFQVVQPPDFKPSRGHPAA